MQYKQEMSQFQPLQFSMPAGGGGGREREQRYAGAGGDVRPLPLGRGGASGEPGPGAVGLFGGAPSTTTSNPPIMPREPHRQTPTLAASFKRRRGSRGRANLTLPRTRRATPPVEVHRWSAMTEAIVRRGPGDPTYEHVIDLYCRTDLGVRDAQRKIMIVVVVPLQPVEDAVPRVHFWTAAGAIHPRDRGPVLYSSPQHSTLVKIVSGLRVNIEGVSSSI